MRPNPRYQQLSSNALETEPRVPYTDRLHKIMSNREIDFNSNMKRSCVKRYGLDFRF